MSINWPLPEIQAELCHDSTKSLKNGHVFAVRNVELILAQHVHDFNTGEHIASGVKGFETEHRSDHSFNGTMVLLNDIVEVFDLSHVDGNVFIFYDFADGRFVGTAFVHHDCFREAVLFEGFVEEAHGGNSIASFAQQEIDC